MNPAVRVRFAPSPTGYLHIGGARTALSTGSSRGITAAHLFSASKTPINRATPKKLRPRFMTACIGSGSNWDEGPHVGGDFGPYFQSERDSIYEKYLQQVAGRRSHFRRRWRASVSVRRASTSWSTISFCGKIDFDLTNPETHPDMTIRRPDGSWIFHFVNVVDDIEMKISHVIRGEDHLSNTPKHIELYRALGATPPRFAHIPLIMNKDGSKMSKRDQGASVDYYIKKGYRAGSRSQLSFAARLVAEG